MRCSLAERNGPSIGDTGLQRTWIESRSADAFKGLLPNTSRAKPSAANATRWGHWGRGTIISKSKRLPRSLMRILPRVFGLREDEVVVTIHCGSRGLGHQIGTDYLREMNAEADRLGLHFLIASWPQPPSIQSLGERYLGAMRAGINCALANRQLLGHLAREVFRRLVP